MPNGRALPDPAQAAKIKQRKDRITQLKMENPKHFNFIRRAPKGYIEAVHCPLCGSVIQSLITDERFEETRTINGQTVVYKKLIMAQTPLYAEVSLVFKDGTNHVASVCTQCKSKVKDNLELIWMSELNEMVELEKRGGGSVPWHILVDKEVEGVEE